MKARPLGGGDDGRRRAGAIVLLDGHAADGAERLGDALHRGEDLGLSSSGEMTDGHRDAQTLRALSEQGEAGLHGATGAHGIGRVGALHHVVGGGQIAHGGGERADVVEADAEEPCACAGEPAIGGLESIDAA